MAVEYPYTEGKMTQEGYTVARGMLAVMNKEMSCYGTIAELTRKQAQALECNDVDLLMSIVRQKQRYIGRVQVLRGEVDRLRAGWERIREYADEPVREELRQTADKLAALISEAVVLEQETMERVDRRKAEVKTKVLSLQAGRNKILGYMHAGTSSRMDKKI